MNRHIPRSPEGIDVVGVPPVTVEITIRKVQHLTHQIQIGVKGQVEKA